MSRKGIFKGIEASITREILYSSRFAVYEPVKKVLGETDPKTTPMWKKFLSGGIVGILCGSLVVPVDIMKTKMQAQPAGECKPFSWHIREHYKYNGGLKGFYLGTNITVIRAGFSSASVIGSYDSAKYFLINNGIVSDGGIFCQFVSSVISGFVSAAITSPFDNIKTRIMLGGYNGIFDCAHQMMYKHGGIKTFFRGFGCQWAGMAPFVII